MSKLDRDIRNALKDTPTVSSNVNRNLAELYAQGNHQPDDNEAGETLILPVERHRKPTLIRRLGTVAACFTAIAVIGGTAASMGGLFSQTVPSAQLEGEDDISSEEENVPPEEISEEVTDPIVEEEQNDYPENTYDMSTKEGIFAKMLNTDKFYDRISGKYVAAYCPQCLESASVNTYQYDVESGKAYSYESWLNLTNSLDDIINGSMPEGWEGGKMTHSEEYCDGDNFYYLNVNDRNGMYSIDNQFKPRTDTLNAAQILDEVKGNSNWYDSTKYLTLKPIHFNVTAPVLIISCLSDFDNWDFEPASTEYGDAVLINGSTTHYERFDTPTNFSMTVDCATGLIISYTDYDLEGNLYDYFIVHDLKINEDAEEVPEIDMNDYTLYDTNADWGFEYGFRVNSSGKTYGGVNSNPNSSGGISAENRENLPDYVAFGEGYVNTDEFIETIGDERVLNDTHQYRTPSETEELLYTVNVYTSEGEYAYSVYYYAGYIDQ